MAGETVITIIGNLTADPELRFTTNGNPVASFTIASTPRSFDRQANEWRDGEALFMRCTAWREMAENIAESLTKGQRVIARGRLEARSYTTREGENRTTMELQVDEIGPSLRWARAQVTRMGRDSGGYGGGNRGGNQGSQGGPSYGSPQGGQPNPGGADDPWATGGSTGFDDAPPF